MNEHHTTAVKVWSRVAIRSAALLCALGLASWAQAQNAIRSVTASTQGGTDVIRIETASPLSVVPNGFATQSPARIALDFPATTNAIGRSNLELGQGNLRSANVVEAGDRTRVVLNLGQAANYKTQLDGNALLVLLDPVAVTSAPTASTATAFAEGSNRSVLPLKDIDFRRTAEGTGRVIVDLSNSQVGVDIRQQGKNLVVEFLKTSLPEGLRRRMDVIDFGTPVQTITTTQSGDRVRMVVEPKGNWEHSAYQSDSQFVLEVREVKLDPNKLSQGPGYTGEKISLNFQNIEIRSLLQVIADFTNFNIITSDSVTGQLTLRLKDVPWDQALDIILQSKRLGMRKRGNVLWVAPNEELLASEKLELETAKNIRALEAVRTQSFRLNFAKADDVAKYLSSSVGTGEGATRMLSRQGSVFAEARTNQVFVTDIPSKLEEVQALIAKLDIPVRQVLIEARIVEAQNDFSKALGVKLGGFLGGNGVRVGSNNGNQTRGSFGFGTVGATGDQFTSVPSSAAGSNAIGFSLFNPGGTRLLNLEINASESDGKLRTIASPRVVTADQKAARIEDGRKIPVLKKANADGAETTFESASLVLQVTPQITPEGSVILDLDVRNDTPIVFNGATAIQTKNVQTQVLIENGGTVVIGGIYLQEETEGVDKVPLLGDVPVLGNLFKSRNSSVKKSELLVFITPRVLTDLGPQR